MDLRDVLPSGEGQIELRALAHRRYRLELQFEAVLEAPTPSASPDGVANDPEAGRFPFRLCVERSDGAILYERARELGDLFAMASTAPGAANRTAQGTALGPGAGRSGASAAQRVWGSVPLLEFETPELGRLCFDFAIEPRTRAGRLEKAQLVLKENVRPLRVTRTQLDFVHLEAAVPSDYAR